MTRDETREFGLINQGLMIQCDTTSYRLSAGTTDTIHIFKSSIVIYVLTVNYHLDFLGLDAYIGTETEPIDSIFLQGDSSIKECLGTNWHSLPLTSLATRLIQLFA
jgi:hypothetical protein